MRIMCVSDIHGDINAMDRIREKFVEEGADRLLILGDILYHGPRNDLPEGYDPKKVTSVLNSMKDRIIAVRGNCDTEVDQMVLEFPIMADYVIIISGEKEIFATHGHHYSPESLPPAMRPGMIFLSGHTHVTVDEVRDGIRFMNPGCLPIPKEGSVPSYIIIDDGDAELKRF